MQKTGGLVRHPETKLRVMIPQQVEKQQHLFFKMGTDAGGGRDRLCDFSHKGRSKRAAFSVQPTQVRRAGSAEEGDQLGAIHTELDDVRPVKHLGRAKPSGSGTLLNVVTSISNSIFTLKPWFFSSIFFNSDFFSPAKLVRKRAAFSCVNRNCSLQTGLWSFHSSRPVFF